MQWFRTVLREVFGLFVDDIGFAVTIIIWLGIMWLVLSRLAVTDLLGALMMFTGLALILLESTVRRSKR